MSLTSPDKAERQWMSDVEEFGCIVCFLFGHVFTPCCVHHLLHGSVRRGHLHTIGLCPTHHNGGHNTSLYVSRHPFRRAFEERYGTEQFLLEASQQLIEKKKSLLVVGYDKNDRLLQRN